MKSEKREEQPQVLGFLGVAFDNQDGEHRLTQSEHFLLVGGSDQTHEKMQDTAIRFGEGLQKRGKRLQETCPEEALDLLRDALES